MTIDVKKIVVLALVFGATVIACDSKKVGDACETYRSSECGGGDGATCLGNNSGNYCTISCKAASDWPNGWKCDSVKSMTVNGKGETQNEKTSRCASSR